MFMFAFKCDGFVSIVLPKVWKYRQTKKRRGLNMGGLLAEKKFNPSNKLTFGDKEKV